MRNKNGFTLMELLIAMTITTIVSAGIFSAYRSQQNANIAQNQGVEMQQNLRAALYIMTRDIRMAGYDPDGLGNFGAIPIGIISNGTGGLGDPLSFSYYVDFGEDGIDNDSDGSIDESDEKGTGDTFHVVSYGLRDGDDNNVADGDTDLVMTTGGNIDILAENISALTFSYLYDPAASTSLLNIRAVKVDITAKHDVNERPLAADRTMATMIKCRNLGL